MTRLIRILLPLIATFTLAGQQPPASTVIRVGGNVQAANLVKQVPPVYPPSMKADGKEARVSLSVLIDREGVPASISLEDTTGPSAFTDAAIEAVKEWRYRPTLLNGQAVEVMTTVTVNFTLAK